MDALQDLITKMADDELILGHRNSEWTGLGPIMEEDIAFSSMAQDKIGHALALYTILQEKLGGQDPDHFAFLRKENEYKCCRLVEYPNGEYDFSLMRHFLFDAAETVRYESLTDSSYAPFRQLSAKIKGELKYHMMHAVAWITQLGNAGSGAHERMQAALELCFPGALGIFEQSMEFEQELLDEKIYPGEHALQQRWLDRIYPVLVRSSLNLPAQEGIIPETGGRKGIHTPYLAPLLEEMSEVFRLDPGTGW